MTHKGMTDDQYDLLNRLYSSLANEVRGRILRLIRKFSKKYPDPYDAMEEFEGYFWCEIAGRMPEIETKDNPEGYVLWQVPNIFVSRSRRPTQMGESNKLRRRELKDHFEPNGREPDPATNVELSELIYRMMLTPRITQLVTPTGTRRRRAHCVEELEANPAFVQNALESQRANILPCSRSNKLGLEFLSDDGTCWDLASWKMPKRAAIDNMDELLAYVEYVAVDIKPFVSIAERILGYQGWKAKVLLDFATPLAKIFNIETALLSEIYDRCWQPFPNRCLLREQRLWVESTFGPMTDLEASAMWTIHEMTMSCLISLS